LDVKNRGLSRAWCHRRRRALVGRVAFRMEAAEEELTKNERRIREEREKS
jgi:hypothetical protein